MTVQILIKHCIVFRSIKLDFCLFLIDISFQLDHCLKYILTDKKIKEIKK